MAIADKRDWSLQICKSEVLLYIISIFYTPPFDSFPSSGVEDAIILDDTISAIEETEFPVLTQFTTFCDDGVFAPFFYDAYSVAGNIFCNSEQALKSRKAFSGNFSHASDVIQIRNPILCVEKGEIVVFAIDTSESSPIHLLLAFRTL